MNRRFRPVRAVCALLLMAAMIYTRVFAIDHAYFGGDKIRRVDLPNGANFTTVWNYPAVDVVVDSIHGKIFWANNATSGTTGTIMVGNLNGSGTASTLLTTVAVEQMQIDVGAQMIYWCGKSSI